MFRIFTLIFLSTILATNAYSQTCGVGRTAQSEVAIVLDFSGSRDRAEILAEKESALVILDYFKQSTALSKISVVTFANDAKLVSSLTTNYNQIANSLSLLPLSGSGGTNIFAGLEMAGNHLIKDGSINSKKYIFFISDGQNNATDALRTLTKSIKENVFVFAFQYPFTFTIKDGVAPPNLMRDVISSTPKNDFYRAVQDNLPLKVQETLNDIGCQDSSPCTSNKCEVGFCVTRENDEDLDGVTDCKDICPNQNDFNVNSTSIVSSTSGTPVCIDQCQNDYSKVVPGVCGCGVKDADNNADGYIDCICSLKTMTTEVTVINQQFGLQLNNYKALIKKQSKTLKNKSPKKKKKIDSKIKKMEKEIKNLLASLPIQTTKCSTSFCSEGTDHKVAIDGLNQKNYFLYSEILKMYKAEISKHGRTRFSEDTLRGSSGAYSSVNSMLKNFPAGKFTCNLG